MSDISVLAQKIASDSMDRSSRIELARLYVEQQESEKAFPLWLEAIAITPASENEQLDWVTLLLDHEHLDEAEKVIDGHVWATADAYTLASEKAYELKDYTRAEQFARTGAAAFPQDVDLLHLCARALIDLDRKGDAIVECRRIFEIAPKHQDALLTWALALTTGKTLRAAPAKYQQALDADPDMSTLTPDRQLSLFSNWGDVLFDLERFEDARDKYVRAMKIDGTRLAMRESVAEADYMLERWFEAMDGYGEVLKDSPDSQTAKLGFAVAQWMCGQTAQAWQTLETLTHPNPLVIPHIRCGMVWGECRYAQARKLASALRELSDSNSEASALSLLIVSEILLIVLQDLDAAERAIVRAGEVAGVRDDMDEAQRKLLRARILLARADTIAVHRRYDRVSLRAEAFAECRAAVALVQQALKEDGNRAATELELRILGRAYLTCEAASETSAEAVLKQLMALPSRLAATEATIGLLQMKARNYAAAIQAFDASVARDSMDIDHRLLLAEALLRAGDLDRAETEIRYVLNRAPDNVDARVMLGRLFIEHGDKGDGDAYAQAVAELITAERIDGTISASKKMTPRELGNLYYHRGFARTKLYDDQKTVKDESVLIAAAQDFQNCEMNDPENHRAVAARRKVNDRLNPRTQGWISDRAAGLVCTILSLGVFFVALTDYVVGDLGAGYASLLIFGSLLFLIASFYLPQLLKLKVGTVELEKSSLESSLARVPLQIRKAAVG